MSIDVKLKDGKGKGTKVCVGKDNSLLTTSTNVPPEDYESIIRPFRQYFTDDGTSTGDSDLRVNGSSTSQLFSILPPDDSDRYIDTLSIAIADAGATLNNFGNISALSNGCRLYYEDPKLGEVTLADGLTSNFEFLRVCAGGVHGIGSGASSYRANNVQGTAEGYLMHLDFTEVFGLPWGIRLPKNSDLKIVMEINDNVSGVDKFDIIAYGFDRIIND